MRLSTAARNAAADAVVDRLDLGSGPATCEIRTGNAPTNVGDSDTGTKLGTVTFSDPAFGSATGGVATAGTITGDSSADASGTAEHFRVKDSDGNVVFDGTCGLGSGDLSFDNNVIVMGGTINVTAFTVTVPIGP